MSKGTSGWIVSPIFDLALLANVAWPLVLLPGFSTDQDTVVDFWQVYFLTLPHRWITLFLVVVDGDRRQQNTKWMICLAILLGAVVLMSYWGLNWGPRAFVCLGFVDYVWNGWHFASQHSGVLRIYSRKAATGSAWLDRWGLRTFVFMTILRTSSAMLWPQDLSVSATLLSYLDWLLLLIPTGLLAVAMCSYKPGHGPKLCYLGSVSLLYGMYLLAGHFHWQHLLLCLATAAALFHAVEYMAVVTHYAMRRQELGSPGIMRWLAERWLATVVGFALTMGILGVYLSGMEGSISIVWQGLNLWAALLHYAFDGMIWKLRQPLTAQSLGVA